MATMPTRTLNQRFNRIVNLSDGDIAKYNSIEAITEKDFKFLDFEDLSGTIALLKRMKLHVIIQYLVRSKVLNTTITIDALQAALATAPLAPTGMGGIPRGEVVSDSSQGASEVYNDPLSGFSGNTVNYEGWVRKSESTIKQTVHKVILLTPTPVGDTVAEAIEVARYSTWFFLV